MKKHIAESLPERKHSPAAVAPAAAKDDKKGDAKGSKTPEARVRQAVYDIRYRARREEVPLQKAFSDYMNHSTMSGKEKSLVRAKLFGKGGMQAEDFNIEDTASSNVANALYKVFVEGVRKEEPIVLTYMEKLETGADRKYKVRVTDKSGSSYVRYATREKISSLRANPNIESVEMTQYGEPYEGERKRGERTAAAKAGKDYDGDGKVESGAKEYRGAVHNAIQRKRGGKPDGQDTSNVKEAFLADANDESVNPDANEKEIDVMKGKNNVVINPELPGSSKNTMRPSMHYAHYEAEGEVIAETDGYSKFLGMLQEKKMTKAAKQKEKNLKKKYDPSGMKASMKKQYGPEKGENVYFATIRKQAMKEEQEEKKGEEYGCEDDSRAKYAEKEVIKNKLRAALGVKNPIVMTAGYEPEGDILDERTRQRKVEGKPRPDPSSISHRVMMDVRNRNKEGLMTRSGETVAKHEERRGVKKDRKGPVESQPPAVTPADKLARRKAQRASAQRAAQDMYKPRAGESD